jgi:putative transposase
MLSGRRPDRQVLTHPLKRVNSTIYPYLLHGLEPERANQLWVADITYLPMAKGFAYLVAIMDLYSRKILSWQVSNTLDPRFCIAALERALARHGAPDIFNTDQGAQFTSQAFTGVLERHGVRISMDGKGRWIGNVFIERFWRSLKYEEVYLYAYHDLSETRAGLERYFGYYNGLRRHSRLGNRTPGAVYRDLLNNPLRPSLPLPIGALTPRPCS